MGTRSYGDEENRKPEPIDRVEGQYRLDGVLQVVDTIDLGARHLGARRTDVAGDEGKRDQHAVVVDGQVVVVRRGGERGEAGAGFAEGDETGVGTGCGACRRPVRRNGRRSIRSSGTTLPGLDPWTVEDAESYAIIDCCWLLTFLC